eukprot:gb/GEZJ01007180.1/.p1 GENE.gb/GEZJ01007180.1/~~gb/GEZJ01007180.1/.p1  ORF type:complete len:206 (+),score=14.73 gb/GEZJ01007180.1/:404-1021(+)
MRHTARLTMLGICGSQLQPHQQLHWRPCYWHLCAATVTLRGSATGCTAFLVVPLSIMSLFLQRAVGVCSFHFNALYHNLVVRGLLSRADHRVDGGLMFKRDKPKPFRVASVMVDHNLCLNNLSKPRKLIATTLATTAGQKPTHYHFTLGGVVSAVQSFALRRAIIVAFVACASGKEVGMSQNGGGGALGGGDGVIGADDRCGDGA